MPVQGRGVFVYFAPITPPKELVVIGYRAVTNAESVLARQQQRGDAAIPFRDDPEPFAAVEGEGNYTLDSKYQNLMVHIAELYNEMHEAGIPNEDARMILPNACSTSIMVSMNARSLVEAATLRTCNRAQWEIRQMFKLMRDSIKDVYPHVWEKCFPNCTKKCGCLEAKPCGNPYEKFSSNK